MALFYLNVSAFIILAAFFLPFPSHLKSKEKKKGEDKMDVIINEVIPFLHQLKIEYVNCFTFNIAFEKLYLLLRNIMNS